MTQVRKKTKKSAVYAPVSFILICLAIGFAISIFFRVSGIEVEGNSLYSVEEILTASGIEKGDNLFFINQFQAIGRLYSKLPYIEKVSISRNLPNKLKIVVIESTALAGVSTDDGDWIIDRSCKLLSKAKGTEPNLITIEGLTVLEPEVAATMTVSEEDAGKVELLAQILYQIDGLGLREDITYVDLSDINAVCFDYLGRFVVRLGGPENLEYKFQALLSAAEQLSEGDRGTLDLSIDNRVHLIYD